MRCATIVTILFAQCAFAGLGETTTETVAHYGQPVKREQPNPAKGEAGWLYEFVKQGYQIQVRFVNRKVAWILYLKIEPIIDSEIQTLLDNNAQGSSWSIGVPDERERLTKNKRDFKRADGLATAEYQETGSYHGLLIMSKAWRDASSSASGL